MKSTMNPPERIRIINASNVKITKSPDFCFNLISSEEYIFIDLKIFAISWHNKTKIIDDIKKYNISDAVVLVNTKDEQEYFEQYINNIGCNNCDILFCNNNAFLNENLFTLDVTKSENERQYDMIINSRFAKYKNVNVAKLCENVAHIGYFKPDENYQMPNFGTYLNFPPNSEYTSTNHIKLNQNDITKHLNNSLVGGMFSPVEGGCLASSEYLLSGLPVVSVQSKGGRDIWYTRENSIICKNYDHNVKKCLDLAKFKLANGDFDRTAIRNTHIMQSVEHRNKLVNYIKDFFDDKNKNFTMDSNELTSLLLH